MLYLGIGAWERKESLHTRNHQLLKLDPEVESQAFGSLLGPFWYPYQRHISRTPSQLAMVPSQTQDPHPVQSPSSHVYFPASSRPSSFWIYPQSRYQR